MTLVKHLTPKAQEDHVLVMEAVRSNNQTAYSRLMANHQNQIYFKLLKMLRNEDDALDLTLETFAKAFVSLHKYNSEYAFSTWLYKIAYNHAIDFLRRKKPETISLDHQNGPEDDEFSGVLHISCTDDTPDQLFIRQERKQVLMEIVEKLSPKYRKLIQLRYFRELSYEEIATEVDLPMGTVKAQLYRAKNHLQKRLEPCKEAI